MPRGGARPGAGRPKGIKELFPRGFVKATRLMKKTEVPKNLPKGLRVPADSSPEAKELADYAFQRYVDVAAGRVPPHKATAVLKGAMEIRKEVCGPIAQKIEANVKGSLELLLTQSMEQKKDGAEAPSAPTPSGTISSG